MHKGHLYCIDTAATQCDKVVVIMFINGEDEIVIRGDDVIKSLVKDISDQKEQIVDWTGNVRDRRIL